MWFEKFELLELFVYYSNYSNNFQTIQTINICFNFCWIKIQTYQAIQSFVPTQYKVKHSTTQTFSKTPRKTAIAS